jgi:ABC-type sugar transport system ATPase subunit
MIRICKIPILSARRLVKRYPGTVALDGVDFEVRSGEVHALIGENGAGKSTLLKIISGVVQPDEGEILVEGIVVRMECPADAQQFGIGLVHQELSLAPNLTVAENIFVRREPQHFGMINWREINRRTRDLLAEFDLSIPADSLVKHLRPGARQVVEIAKAVAIDARVLALDEPTSSLEPHEADLLFRLIRRLTKRGIGVVYISHKMDEVFSLASRLTILRDGKLVSTHDRREIEPREVIRLMVGRTLSDYYPPKASRVGETILELCGVRQRGKHNDISLRVRRGEILGVSGLIGAGRTEAMLSAIGRLPRDQGEVRLDGQSVSFESPESARKAGVIYLPEDRKADGLFVDQGARGNITAASLSACSKYGIMKRRVENRLTSSLVEQLAIRLVDLEQPVRTLSGGNQQKVLLAKCLASKPRVLMVDEPTRGIDVGAKLEIHHLLRRYAEGGGAVILISSDLSEIIGMSDSVAVFRDGGVVGLLTSAEANEESIMRLATGL